MNGKIPKLSAWCSYCVAPEEFGNPPGPCPDHRGPDGRTVDYTGRNAYEPSAWVEQQVTLRFRSYRGDCACFGYDPRHGFWMVQLDTGKCFNVSERAIGRTFHAVRA